MPLAVEGLNPNSSEEEIKKAISDSIAQCISEGRPEDQCKATAHRYAKELTGRSNLRLGFTMEESLGSSSMEPRQGGNYG